MNERRRVWLIIGLIGLVTLLFIPFSNIVLKVRYTYTLRTVALGGSILGLVSGVLGCFAVLRRQSLLGDALSHAALPGVIVGFLVAGRCLPPLLIGAGITSWIGVLFIRLLSRRTRIKEDTSMGIVLAAWFAAGIAGLTYVQGRPDASQAGLDTFIFGQAAAMVRSDVLLIGGVGIVAFTVVAALWKEFKLVTFDLEFAGANGFRVELLTGLLSVLVVVAIVLGLQLAGVILMVGMLIAPGIAARQWTNRLNQMVILAGLFGAFAGGTGAIISGVDANIPTGPMIIVVAFLLVVVSILMAPERGLIWRLIRGASDRRRFAAQKVMRDIYHYAYDHGDVYLRVPEEFLTGLRGGNAKRGLRTLLVGGIVKRVEDSERGATWTLSTKGAEVAAADATNQRLWDLYRQLGYDLKLPVIPEERERDIRALLSEDEVLSLSQHLENRGVEPRVRS